MCSRYTERLSAGEVAAFFGVRKPMKRTREARSIPARQAEDGGERSGPPRLLPQSAWELDDFGWRFAAIAIDPSAPFDRSVAPTHWIFVDTGQFDEILGLVHDDAPRRRKAKPQPVPQQEARDAATSAQIPVAGDRYLHKADVLKLVPMSRSTFDDRVGKGLFPASHDLGGGIVVWWESEVHQWMRGKGGRQSA